MENADEAGMRTAADPECSFVHIGMTCGLDHEVECYTSGAFNPTEIIFHDKKVKIFGETAIVLTDCDYGLLLNGSPTTHHSPLPKYMYTGIRTGSWCSFPLRRWLINQKNLS